MHMDDIGHILVAANLEEDKSLNDLSWWNDGLDEIGQKTIDISEVKNPNNIKPELLYQWRGGPDFDFDDTSAGDVKRIPRKDEKNPKSVIHFARDMMNRGYRFSKVASALKERFANADLVAARDGLKKLAAGDGIIGRFVLDARGYDSCKQAYASLKNSPWKRFVKYVAGCRCGDHEHFSEDSGNSMRVASGKVESVDDCFVKAEDAKKVERCASTHLKVAFTGPEGWSDPSEVDQNLLILSEMGYLPKEKANEIMSSGKSGVAKLCEAFRYIDNVMDENENTKYKTGVSPEEWKVEVQSPDIETKAVEGVELSFDDAQLPGYEGADEIEIGDVEKSYDDAVDMDEAEEEINVGEPAGNDVEFNAVPEGEYEGADEITVDDATQPKKEASVRLGQSVEFEF